MDASCRGRREFKHHVVVEEVEDTDVEYYVENPEDVNTCLGGGKW